MLDTKLRAGTRTYQRFRRGDERQVYITLQWIQEREDFDPKDLESFQAMEMQA